LRISTAGKKGIIRFKHL